MLCYVIYFLFFSPRREVGTRRSLACHCATNPHHADASAEQDPSYSCVRPSRGRHLSHHTCSVREGDLLVRLPGLRKHCGTFRFRLLPTNNPEGHFMEYASRTFV